MIKKIFFILSLILLTLLLIFFLAAAFLPAPGNIPVLVYRYIGSSADAKNSKDFVSRKSFKNQMAFLKRFGYRVISLDMYYDIQSGKRKPKGRELVLTFDDAGSNFEKEVQPVLEKYHFPAGVFLVSERINRGDEKGFSGENLKMGLEAGKWIAGSHSKTHPFLFELNPEQMREEIAGSKTDLESVLGSPIHYFAYPAGPLTKTAKATAQEAGYWLAFSSSFKELPEKEDAYSIVRVKITRTADYPFVYWFKISGIYQAFKRERYYLKHAPEPAA